MILDNILQPSGECVVVGCSAKVCIHYIRRHVHTSSEYVIERDMCLTFSAQNNIQVYSKALIKGGVWTGGIYYKDITISHHNSCIIIGRNTQSDRVISYRPSYFYGDTSAVTYM